MYNIKQFASMRQRFPSPAVDKKVTMMEVFKTKGLKAKSLSWNSFAFMLRFHKRTLNIE